MSDRFLTQQALKSASVMGIFTLDGLCKVLNLPKNDLDRRDLVWRVLSRVADEKVTDRQVYCWQLDPDARRSTLAQFYTPRLLKGFLEQMAPQGHDHMEDPFSRALGEILHCDRISFDDPGGSADLPGLREALTRAAAILDAAEFAKDVPALKDVSFETRISDRTPYQSMTIQQLARFAGAQIKELQARSDLRIVLPNTHFGYGPQRDTISRFGRGLGEEKPLLLTGIGGTGKSALLSRLMLGWQRSTPEMIQVLLDFDRRQLSQGEPVEILQEILRQMLAFLKLANPPGAAEILDGLRAMRPDIALYKTTSEGNRASNADQLSRVLHEITPLSEPWASPLTEMPMLVALDTFEAIDRMAVYNRSFAGSPFTDFEGNEVVSQIMNLLASLQIHLPNMRVIVSGREEPLSKAELKQWFGSRIHLNGLHPASGANLLQSELGRLNPANYTLFDDDAKARQVSKLLGGHPLAIIAFAKYADSNPLDVSGLIAELEAEGGFAAEFAQVFLYTRILNRITDPQVRPLAHPGLMLRSIDADMILNILAGPCLRRGEDSDDALTKEGAEDLLNRLRNQYWLVSPVTAEAKRVRHIPELRRLMLPGLLAGPSVHDTGAERDEQLDLQARAFEVCAAAAVYFRARNSKEDTLNASYYGAFNTDPPAQFSKELATDLDRHLGEDVATMPIAWRAVIRHLLGQSLTPREDEALPEQYRDEENHRVMSKVQQTGTQTFSKEFSRKSKESISVSGLNNNVAKVAKTGQEIGHPLIKTATLMEQSYELRSHWSNPDLLLPDRAHGFLENFIAAAVSPDAEKEILRLNEDANSDPFENAAYIAVLLHLTGHTPWTPQFGLPENVSLTYPETIHTLLSAASHAEQMEFDAAGEALHRYLETLRNGGPIATNRLAFGNVLRFALGLEAQVSGELQLSGLSLAVGTRSDLEDFLTGDETQLINRLSYQRSLQPLWEERQIDGLSLTMLERFYRLEEPLILESSDFARMTSREQQHFAAMLRGLTPELYPPTISLLSSLDSETAETVIFETTKDLGLWPTDLEFDEQNYYQKTDASVVVETTDRCGALRQLIENLVPHDPFAERLLQFHDLITDIYFHDISDLLSGRVK